VDLEEETDTNKASLLKCLRRLAKNVNCAMAQQAVDRLHRFANMHVRDAAAFGDDTVGVGDVVAVVFLVSTNVQACDLGFL
jgi:hypothetical protein